MTTDNTAIEEIVESKVEEIIEVKVEEVVEEKLEEIVDEKIEEKLESHPTIEYDECDPLGTLKIDGAPLGRVLKGKVSASDVEYVEKEVEELKSDLEGGSPTAKGGGSTAESDVPVEDLTTMEKLATAGDPDEIADTPRIQRAITIFKNLTSWGRKVPKGYTITADDKPLKLLEAERDENLSWNLYYRAAKKLESLTEGAITFVHPDGKGKRLILHKDSDVYDRVTSGSLTVSSVGDTARV